MSVSSSDGVVVSLAAATCLGDLVRGLAGDGAARVFAGDCAARVFAGDVLARFAGEGDGAVRLFGFDARWRV